MPIHEPEGLLKEYVLNIRGPAERVFEFINEISINLNIKALKGYYHKRINKELEQLGNE